MGVKQKTKSLQARQNVLAQPYFQLKVLGGQEFSRQQFTPFQQKAGKSITPVYPEIFQVNIGKLCNQSCAHCHVDAGPDKKRENMSRETLEKCLDILSKSDISTVDITGGAPEMNPHFRWFVQSCRQLGKKVMDRCNLTILEANETYADLPQFFAEHQVHIVSSLPYFSKNRTDSQRGEGVFADSISALQKLNSIGYGKEGTGLILDLVYNPSGAFLPGSQLSLETEFKSQLKRRFGIEFNQLYVITNLPISRFLEYLLDSGNYEEYMESLIEAFNPATLDGLMCKNTLSISWDGYIYDCDFNQMLDIKVESKSNHIDNFNLESLMKRNISFNQHCYGCTAGAGSSCGGEIA